MVKWVVERMTKELAINLLRGSVLGTNDQLHEAVFIAIKALKNEPIVRCKDCKHSVMTIKGECKYCRAWDATCTNKLYLSGDFYCGFGERREDG